jgi:hypothetical protein
MAREASQRRALRYRAPRARRHANTVISYREPSSNIDEEPDDAMITAESDELPEAELPPAQSQRRRKVSKRPTGKRRRHSSSPSPAPSDSSQILYEQPAKKRTTRRRMPLSPPQSTACCDKDQYSAGVIPPWQSLPYHVLVQIFHYASYPLYEDRTSQPTFSVGWLVKTARLCRSFAEPALTVLYKSPPLVPMERAHKLRQLLTADPSPMTYNYRAKIERLQIEVSQTVTYTLPGYGLLDLYGLIRNCPRLVDLEIYHQKDMPPYRLLDDTIKFTYPTCLFVALEETTIKLRSWQWNSRMAGPRRPIDKLRDIHLKPSFIGLRKLCFVNYQQFQPRKNVEDPQLETHLAEALSVLPNLEYLIFESSSLLNAKLLPLLPMNLKHLELINCWELLSEDMASFLVTHGNHLRSLILNHNQSLSLSFLQVLGSACQNLTALKMNLTYYSTHMTYRDSEPLYEKLLFLGEVPQWPASLQELELTHLRNWDIDAAEMFFQSLVDSAVTLLDLRRIVIKAILNTSWRDRVKFRDTWVPTLMRVFKRPYNAPDQNLRSLGAFAAHKNETSRLQNSRLMEATSRDTPGSNTRTSSPLSVKGRNIEDEDADAESLGKKTRENRLTRRSSRLVLANSSSRVATRELAILQQTASMNQMKERPLYNRGSSISGVSSHNNNGDFDSDDEPLVRRVRQARERRKEFAQGMCDVVSITVDNLRPTETQFVEADFLDSEPEGDEDWDGS